MSFFNKITDWLFSQKTTIVATTVSIPLFAQIIHNKSSFSEQVFHFFMLVFLIKLSKQMDLLASGYESLKNTQEKVTTEIEEVKQLIIESNEKRVKTSLELEDSVSTLFEVINSQANFEFEITNRNLITPDEGYKQILSKVKLAKKKVKIISPRKSNYANCSSRKNYFTDLEKWIDEKVRMDKGFIYQRLIPTNFIQLRKEELLFKECQLLKHCKSLVSKYPNTIDIGFRLVENINVPMNFILIDETYLIVLFPKLTLNGTTLSNNEDCAFHIIIKDKKKKFIKILERQFDVLYSSCKYSIDHVEVLEN